jgi:hypothetical protein
MRNYVKLVRVRFGLQFPGNDPSPVGVMFGSDRDDLFERVARYQFQLMLFFPGYVPWNDEPVDTYVLFKDERRVVDMLNASLIDTWDGVFQTDTFNSVFGIVNNVIRRQEFFSERSPRDRYPKFPGDSGPFPY